MICAETFGCSGKLPFSETRKLAATAGLASLGNFSEIAGSDFIVSIDRISRCTMDWSAFAKIAISHASRDIEVGLAVPIHTFACFEFGEDAEAVDREALVGAFNEAARQRSITVGKCHSAKTASEVTSLVVALVGAHSRPICAPASNGLVWINGPIGLAKLLYLEGLKPRPEQKELVDRLSRPLDLRGVATQLSILSDVSGHGLAGCLCDLAERYLLSIEVTLSPTIVASTAVLDTQTSLLENPLDDYPKSILVISEDAKSASLLKETAGPVVGLSSQLSDADLAKMRAHGWTVIGSYKKESARVAVNWS